jgi:hypothetical protein
LRVGGDEADQRRLIFDKAPDLPPDVGIDVWGQVHADRILVDRFKLLSADSVIARSALIDGPPLPTRSFAFVIVDIGGGPGTLTPAQATTRVFGTGPTDASTKQFYLENSYGRRDITGGVVGPLSYAQNSCDYSSLASSLRNQVNAALGFTPQHYIWYYATRNPSCGWTALATVGSPNIPARDSWLNNIYTGLALAQESLHNFGLMHAASLRCPGAAFANDPTTCTNDEYNDRYDVMGIAYRHLNAWNKGSQGFFGGCNRVRVNSSGTFTLLPAEVECNGIQVLQIPMPVQNRMVMMFGGRLEPVNFYYLELRTRVGFDQPMTNAPTVLVHVGQDYRPPTQAGKPTWLLDMVPATSGLSSFDGMPVGVPFTDPAGGLSFVVQSVSASGATINVTIANGSGAPTCFDGGSITPPGPATCGP